MYTAPSLTTLAAGLSSPGGHPASLALGGTKTSSFGGATESAYTSFETCTLPAFHSTRRLRFTSATPAPSPEATSLQVSEKPTGGPPVLKVVRGRLHQPGASHNGEWFTDPAGVGARESAGPP